MMELDSQSITPPSSPIIGLGYSACADEQSIVESDVIYCLNCKGPLRPNDDSFSPEGLILRREVISALDNLKNEYVPHSGEKHKLTRCFGFLFDPLDQKQMKNMIRICRKHISSLEVLSIPSHSSWNQLQNPPSCEEYNDVNNTPWTLRRSVCQFMGVIVRRLKYYRAEWKIEELHGTFAGLKKSLASTKDWPHALKNFCGFRGGNEQCSSPIYHFVHLQLELKWSLFLIFGATPASVNCLLDDLIQLAKFKYDSENATSSLDKMSAFNCMCVKEIWTMAMLVIDNLNTEEKGFWNYYAEAMQRVSDAGPFLSIWFTSNISQISDYCISGLHRPGLGRSESSSNAYPHVHSTYKAWMDRGGKSAEVLKLSFNFFRYWGVDCDILICLLSQWIPRLDSRNDVSNLESYSAINNWIKLIIKICESSCELCGTVNDDKENFSISSSTKSTAQSSHQQNCFGSNKDPFLELVCLVAGFAREGSERDIRRIKAHISVKVTRNAYSSNDFGEIGIIRLSSLFMALSTVVKSEREAISMFERLQDIIPYGKVKNTPGRRKAVLRAYSCMLLILLQRKVCLSSNVKVSSLYMKTVDELLFQASSDESKRDLVMVYLDLLDCIPKLTPALCHVDIGRVNLVATNLSIWFSKAGHNYVARTARSMSQITEWIVSWVMDPNTFDLVQDSEGKALFTKISEKTVATIRSIVILSSNRIPSTDVEPLACLAADITLLSRSFGGIGSRQECESHFDLFAMNERTCPLVSQYFVQRLFKSTEFIDSFSLLKWTQTWIRLVALDCSIPDGLTGTVLGTSFQSTCNQDLLREFCKKDDDYGRDDIQKFLSPLVLLLKGVLSASVFKAEKGDHDSEHIINSVITSCAVVIRNVKFEYLYIKGMMKSVAHQILTEIAPISWGVKTPPWERFSPAIMRSLERNFYDVFEAVVSYPNIEQDPFMNRKLQDILVFSFFGFTAVNPNDIDKKQHPAIVSKKQFQKILEFSEKNGITIIQNQILPHIIAGDHVVTDLKLCQLFLATVQILRSKQLATIVMRVLEGVIRIFLIHCNSVDKQAIMNRCINTVVYCCLVGSSSSPHYKQLVRDSFKTTFVKEFNHRSRGVFYLCMAIAKSKNSSNGRLDAKRFLKMEVVPLLKEFVELGEQRRGIGSDKSLREPLEHLEFELTNVV